MAFKVGDIVQLRSGGPIMTVSSFGQGGDAKPRVNCVWFDKSDAERHGSYPAETLEMYSEKDPTVA